MNPLIAYLLIAFFYCAFVLYEDTDWFINFYKETFLDSSQMGEMIAITYLLVLALSSVLFPFLLFFKVRNYFNGRSES